MYYWQQFHGNFDACTDCKRRSSYVAITNYDIDGQFGACNSPFILWHLDVSPAVVVVSGGDLFLFTTGTCYAVGCHVTIGNRYLVSWEPLTSAHQR